ncbi:hypothetical protein CSAL01_12697 [Colletotrichum salicis]|uniref:Uncharacterized protein n=1 Tax=Colletotrichum salicis TaxID=1209931 RepID=A0A135TNB1_9PEZI|nr:hypothetical protein CSAL01_12697 [Colletotrichum salicis]
MQPITPPQTPQKADNKPTDDVHRELRKLNGSLDQMKRHVNRLEAMIALAGPRLHHTVDASTATTRSSFSPSHDSTGDSTRVANPPPTFWSKQSFSAENFKDMKVLFRDVMIYGPGHTIRGVREQPVSDLAMRADDPPTVLCFGGPNHLGEMTMKPKYLPVMEEDSKHDRSQEWDLWEKVNEHLLNQWPDSVVSSHLHQTGHFDHDLKFLGDTCFAYHEIAHARGRPELVFWKRRGESGPAQFPESSFQQGQITGRAWQVCPRQQVVNAPMCALIFTQLACGNDEHTWDMAKCVIALLRSEGHLQFHVRYPRLSSAPIAQESRIAGYYVCRKSFPVTEIRKCNKIHLVEERVAIGVTTTLHSASPCYTAVTLADSPKLITESEDEHELWKSRNLSSCGKLIGVAAFQSMIHGVIRQWAVAWTSILDDLLLEVVRLPDTNQGEEMSPQSWSRWVDDTSKDLRSLQIDAAVRLHWMKQEATTAAALCDADLHPSRHRVDVKVPESISNVDENRLSRTPLLHWTCRAL